MNRLKLVMSYCSSSVKAHNPKKYEQAQRLKSEIIAKEDKKISNSKVFTWV
ncbi:MAG: hypothetical protein GQ570_12120 [Helicobacteraceae bacterium]|nr:hypothetical protein [Helicobacteraceae bacterium]